MEKSVRSVRQVVGENARRIREDAGARQDDIASSARRLGASWSRSKLAALERGDKAVDLEDLVVLAGVLHSVTGETVTLADLFAGDGLIAVTDKVQFRRAAVQKMLSGGAVRITGGDVPELVERGMKVMTAFAERLGRSADLMGADVPFQLVEEIQERSGETEERAARTLDVPLADVVAVSVGLWGQTLQEERDQRAGDADTKAALSAKRGRVTRQLLDEIRERIREVDGDGVDR